MDIIDFLIKMAGLYVFVIVVAAILYRLDRNSKAKRNEDL